MWLLGTAGSSYSMTQGYEEVFSDGRFWSVLKCWWAGVSELKRWERGKTVREWAPGVSKGEMELMGICL